MKTYPVEYIKVDNYGLFHSDGWFMDRYVIAWYDVYETLIETEYNVIDRVLIVRI